MLKLAVHILTTVVYGVKGEMTRQKEEKSILLLSFIMLRQYKVVCPLFIRAGFGHRAVLITPDEEF